MPCGVVWGWWIRLLSGGFLPARRVLAVCLGLWRFLVWLFGLSLPGFLAFPCCVSGLLALPLCGAALTFFAAAKKVSKESGLPPPAYKWVPRAVAVVVHLESVPSRNRCE